MKTAELTGAALDWAVAKCEGKTIENIGKYGILINHDEKELIYKPSQWWALGGDIVERKNISVVRINGGFAKDEQGFTTTQRIILWGAAIGIQDDYCIFEDEATAYWFEPSSLTTGQTPLIAAMRCYVASKLGDEVDAPEELL